MSEELSQTFYRLYPGGKALTRLYKAKGWDEQTGMPTRERLEALSLDWAADLMGA